MIKHQHLVRIFDWMNFSLGESHLENTHIIVKLRIFIRTHTFVNTANGMESNDRFVSPTKR